MKKEDLEYGNVVETRNGDKYVYNIGKNIKFLMCLNRRGYNLLDDYNQDLIIEDDISHEYNIVKVYTDYTCKELLWERKEITLTEDEKVILRNVDKEFKYIARDKNGNLFISDDKPYKDTIYWDCNSMYDSFPYNHLFQFIKWEDEEPYSIEELLR